MDNYNLVVIVVDTVVAFRGMVFMDRKKQQLSSKADVYPLWREAS